MAQAPQLLQDEWLLQSITNTIDPNSSYVNPIVHKSFVKDGRVSVSESTKKSALLRIVQFLKVTKTGGITAILTDNRHKVLANFKYNPAISNFESKYRQRITYNTLNSLIMINQCDLKFINKFDLINNYDKSFNSKYEVVILDIIGCDIYQRDQVQFNFKFENSLTFVYEDSQYKTVCTIPGNADGLTEKVDALISNDYDDMISI